MLDDVPLKVDGLTKSFGSGFRWMRFASRRWGFGRSGPVTVLDRATFTVREREIYGVIGANGSGKSTLVRMLSTLMLPDGGTAQVFGLDVVKQAMEVRRLINRVSADPSFFRTMSAMDNLRFFARVYGLPPSAVGARGVEILGRLGLSRSQAQEPMRNLSRGQQQKAAVARAFLTSPVLMLLDEPTTGLDPRSKREVQTFIQEIREEHDACVLVTTHDMEEAEILCDRLCVLSEGRIVAEGTPDELKASVAAKDGRDRLTMEDVYMEITGRSIEEEDLIQEEAANV